MAKESKIGMLRQNTNDESLYESSRWRSIFISISLKRCFRYFHKLAAPEKFLASSRGGVNSARALASIVILYAYGALIVTSNELLCVREADNRA